LDRAIAEAEMTWDEIDAIAVTEGPGLVGALIIGVNAAKAIAFAKGKPLIPVHHIAGHIYANQLENEFEFPLLALIVSGGHTELIVMKEHGKYEVIGETLDDAAGEAFDKVARVLDLPYPGGQQIDKLAKEGTEIIELPRAWLEKDSYNFSFSSLKSAVINYIHNKKQKNESINKADVATSFQASVVDVLIEKTYKAAIEYDVKQVIVAGGVAANSGLRTALEERFKSSQIPLMIPPLYLCTDNAAMIGAAASVLYEKEEFADWDLNANPGLILK